MRAAWEQAIESDVERALRLASALEWFWGIRGTFKEERIWLTRLLPLTKVWGPSKHRAQALRMAGKIASATGDNESARPLLEAGLAIAKAVGDKPTLAITLHNLGDVFIDIGNLSEARACLEDSLALYREVGDAWGIGLTTRTLGRLARDAGDYESAHTLYEESLLVYRSLGDKLSLMLTLNSIGELVRLQGDYSGASAFYAESLQLTREIRTRFSQGSLLHNLGHVALHERDYVRARALFEESLAVYRQRENTHGLTLCVAGFAGIMGATGKPQQAAQLIGAVEASFEAIDTPMDPVDRMEYDRNVAAVRAQLDEATFNAAWAEGRKMTLEQAIQYALEKL
jgi:tetratricopeptide (TPR) repeat protein